MSCSRPWSADEKVTHRLQRIFFKKYIDDCLRSITLPFLTGFEITLNKLVCITLQWCVTSKTQSQSVVLKAKIMHKLQMKFYMSVRVRIFFHLWV